MTLEYRQLVVHSEGWLEIKLSGKYITELNHLAQSGWEVDQMVPIHTGISGTSAVVILLKRDKMGVQS